MCEPLRSCPQVTFYDLKGSAKRATGVNLERVEPLPCYTVWTPIRRNHRVRGRERMWRGSRFLRAHMSGRVRYAWRATQVDDDPVLRHLPYFGDDENGQFDYLSYYESTELLTKQKSLDGAPRLWPQPVGGCRGRFHSCKAFRIRARSSRTDDLRRRIVSSVVESLAVPAEPLQWLVAESLGNPGASRKPRALSTCALWCLGQPPTCFWLRRSPRVRQRSSRRSRWSS